MGDTSKRFPQARTVEERENQLISLATDEAERRIRNGSATSQLLVHYLKLGTEKARLENEKLKAENQLLIKKAEAAEATKQSGQLYEEAIKAFRKYSGQEDSADDQNIF